MGIAMYRNFMTACHTFTQIARHVSGGIQRLDQPVRDDPPGHFGAEFLNGALEIGEIVRHVHSLV